MWASALTLPAGSTAVEHGEVAAVRLEQGVAERAVEPAGAASIGSQSNSLRSSE